MKKSFEIVDSKIIFKNERATVVQVVIFDKKYGGAYTACGRAVRHPEDVEDADYAFKLARDRAIEKAVKKTIAETKFMIKECKATLRELEEQLDRQKHDVADAERRIVEKIGYVGEEVPVASKEPEAKRKAIDSSEHEAVDDGRHIVR